MAGVFTNQIRTINWSEMSDFDRIDRNLKTLMESIEFTIPGSRGFGMPIQALDSIPPEVAQNEFAAALDEKIAIFMPEIRVADIEYDISEGLLQMDIYIEENDDYDGEDEE